MQQQAAQKLAAQQRQQQQQQQQQQQMVEEPAQKKIVGDTIHITNLATDVKSEELKVSPHPTHAQHTDRG